MQPPHSAFAAPDFGPAQTLVRVARSGPEAPNPFSGKSRDFWLVFLALCVSCFLSALDLTAVSTVIPTMAAALDSNQYAWIGTAYALASTALVPWTAGLANIFGRRSTMIGSLLLFAIGSAVTGSAQTMEAATAGRTVQGLGGGGS
jgi:MFS family permease